MKKIAKVIVTVIVVTFIVGIGGATAGFVISYINYNRTNETIEFVNDKIDTTVETIKTDIDEYNYKVEMTKKIWESDVENL